MSRAAKDISNRATMRKPPYDDTAWVSGGVWMKEIGPASFGILCAGSRPRLRAWRHAHVFDRFWRVYYNFTPGAYLVQGGEKYHLGPRQFVVMPANLMYETFLKAPWVDHFFLHFTMAVGLAAERPLVLPAGAGAKAIVRELAEGTRQRKADQLVCYHRSMALLYQLLAEPLARQQVSGPRPEMVRLLNEIEAHPTALSDARAMAEFAGMSLRNLQRHFQKATGKSPARYLNEVRLREAARRLAGSTECIDQIADELGFANRFHFSRLFRIFTGSPPAAFRQLREQSG